MPRKMGEGEEEDEEFRTPPPDLMTLVIEGRTPQGMFPVTIYLTMMTDNIVVQGGANREGRVGIFSNEGERLIPFLGCSGVFCPCPHRTTSFGDKEDSSSSEESSSNDSYVEAPLENTQVRDCCFSYVVEKLTIALGSTCSFSDGRSTRSCGRSSELFSRK